MAKFTQRWSPVCDCLNIILYGKLVSSAQVQQVCQGYTDKARVKLPYGGKFRQGRSQPSAHHLAKLPRRAWSHESREGSAPLRCGPGGPHLRERMWFLPSVCFQGPSTNQKRLQRRVTGLETGNWVEWGADEGTLCVGLEKMYLEGWEVQKGEWQEAVFKYLQCCQVEERLGLCCAAPEGKHKASEYRLQDKVSAEQKEAFYNYGRYSKQIVVPSDALGSVCAKTKWISHESIGEIISGFFFFFFLVWLIKGNFLKREKT